MPCLSKARPAGELNPVVAKSPRSDTSRRELPNRVAAKVGDVEVASLVEGNERGCDKPGGGEDAQVFSGPRELPNRVVASIGDVEIASLVEGDATSYVQPAGGEVAQVYTGRRELPNPADVCHVEVAVLVEGDATGKTQPGGSEVAQVCTSRRELPNRVAINVGDVEVAALVKGQAEWVRSARWSRSRPGLHRSERTPESC